MFAGGRTPLVLLALLVALSASGNALAMDPGGPMDATDGALEESRPTEGRPLESAADRLAALTGEDSPEESADGSEEDPADAQDQDPASPDEEGSEGWSPTDLVPVEEFVEPVKQTSRSTLALIFESTDDVDPDRADSLLGSVAVPVLVEEDQEPPAPEPTSDAPAPAIPPAAMVAAGVATATGAGVLFFWITGSSASTAGTGIAASKGGYAGAKKVAPIFSPLFTRFEGKKVLEHPNRAALYETIAIQPGVRLQDLCDKTGLSRTAVTHHLRLLEGQHLVVSRRMGRSRHYFENGGRFEREQKDAYAVLQNDRTRAIADYVQSHPGAIQKQLCEALDLRPSVAHWHVKRLIEAELVRGIRDGRTVSYYPDGTMARVAL